MKRLYIYMKGVTGSKGGLDGATAVSAESVDSLDDLLTDAAVRDILGFGHSAHLDGGELFRIDELRDRLRAVLTSSLNSGIEDQSLLAVKQLSDREYLEMTNQCEKSFWLLMQLIRDKLPKELSALGVALFDVAEAKRRFTGCCDVALRNIGSLRKDMIRTYPFATRRPTTEVGRKVRELETQEALFAGLVDDKKCQFEVVQVEAMAVLKSDDPQKYPFVKAGDFSPLGFTVPIHEAVRAAELVVEKRESALTLRSEVSGGVLPDLARIIPDFFRQCLILKAVVEARKKSRGISETDPIEKKLAASGEWGGILQFAAILGMKFDLLTIVTTIFDPKISDDELGADHPIKALQTNILHGFREILEARWAKIYSGVSIDNKALLAIFAKQGDI